MPKTINNPYWGVIPVCGPQSYDYYLNSKEVSTMKHNTPTDAKWLEPNPRVTNQKSFYHRAYVKEYAGSEYYYDVLYSYETPVAAIVYDYEHSDRPDGQLHLRLWGGWSATTAKHFQSFWGEKISKAEWQDMLVHNLADVMKFASTPPVVD